MPSGPTTQVHASAARKPPYPGGGYHFAPGIRAIAADRDRLLGATSWPPWWVKGRFRMCKDECSTVNAIEARQACQCGFPGGHPVE